MIPSPTRAVKAVQRPSLVQMSAPRRLSLALVACAVVWAAIGLALVR